MLYHGDTHRIRLLDECDLDFAASLRADPLTTPYLGTAAFLNSVRQRAWFESLSNSDTRAYFVLETAVEPIGETASELSWERVGIVRVTDIDRINRSMCVGGDITPQRRGRGLGRTMYSLILKLAFDCWNLHRVWLLVLANNTRAMHLYEQVGFVKEGVHRDAVFKDGKYVDYILMGMLRNEYRSKLDLGVAKDVA